MKNRKLVIDIETGGTNPNLHPILSLGLVVLDGKTTIAETEYWISRGDRQVDATAMAINKIDLVEHEKRAQQPQDVVRSLTSFVQHYFPNEAAVPVGHNVDFDLSFIKALFESQGLLADYNKVLSYRKLDTQSIIRYYQDAGHFPKDVSGLGSWLGYFGINHNQNELHGALYDARVTAHLYVKLLEYGEKLLEKSRLSTFTNI